MEGVVTRSTGSFYDVLASDEKKYSCRARGKFRLDEIKETNPIAVGDRVQIDEVTGSIIELLPRKNFIVRQSTKKTGHSHVLAANIDQVMFIATLKLPRTSLGFIDRFLVSAESFRIPQILIFNKNDLLNDKEKVLLQGLIHLYQSIGVTTLVVSALNDNDFDAVQKLLNNKVTLVAGHSGVGKSTLLNSLSPLINQTVKEVSDFSEKGTHSTTFSEMFQIENDTFIIDTPGIKEWGLMEMNQQEISDYFPEMREVRLKCKFGARCLHINEPKCAILDAVTNGSIAESRYLNYLNMVSGKDNRK